MKKFFAIIIMVTMIIGVTITGPEKAFAEVNHDKVTATHQLSDVDRLSRALDGLKWYVENNPNWDEKVVKIMIHQENDEVVLASTWIDSGEWHNETVRYTHDEVVEIDALSMCMCAAGKMGVWLD